MRGKGRNACQCPFSRCWPVPPLTTTPRRLHGPCWLSERPPVSCGRGAGSPRCQPSRSGKRYSGLPEKSDVSGSSTHHFFLTGETVRFDSLGGTDKLISRFAYVVSPRNYTHLRGSLSLAVKNPYFWFRHTSTYSRCTDTAKGEAQQS